MGWGLWALCVPLFAGAQPAGPVIVVETTKGTFEVETFPAEAPKTVAHILELVKRGFYDGQRVHRALPGFLVQWGDPRSKDLSRETDWGRGPDAVALARVRGWRWSARTRPAVAAGRMSC